MILTLPNDDALRKLLGFLEPLEGQRLAYLASLVPHDEAIVEVGSYRGKSTCYLGYGSRWGHNAPVFAVDQWDSVSGNPVYNPAETFRCFLKITQGLDVTPLKGGSVDVARIWTRPIGLLFIDAEHRFESVSRDYLAWSPFLVRFLAMHDYGENTAINGVYRTVEEIVKPSGLWDDYQLHHTLFSAKRR